MSLKKILVYHFIVLLVVFGLLVVYDLFMPSPPGRESFAIVPDAQTLRQLFLLAIFIIAWFVSLTTFILGERLKKRRQIGVFAENQNLAPNNIAQKWHTASLFTTATSVLTIFPGTIFMALTENPFIPAVIAGIVAVTNFVTAIGLSLSDKTKKLLPVFSILMSAIVIIVAYYSLAIITQR